MHRRDLIFCLVYTPPWELTTSWGDVENNFSPSKPIATLPTNCLKCRVSIVLFRTVLGNKSSFHSADSADINVYI